MEARRGDGGNELLDAVRNHLRVGLHVAGAGVRQRRNRIFLEGVIAERFGDDEIDLRGIVDFGRGERNEMTVARLIAGEHLLCDAGYLGPFV